MLSMVADARRKEGNSQMTEGASAIQTILGLYEQCAGSYWGGGL